MKEKLLITTQDNTTFEIEGDLLYRLLMAYETFSSDSNESKMLLMKSFLPIIDKQGNQLLLELVRKWISERNLLAIKMILEFNKNLVNQYIFQKTMLLLALELSVDDDDKARDLIAFLLQQENIDPNLGLSGITELTPLMYVARKGDLRNLKLLVDHPKIILDKVDNRGWLAIHYACDYWHYRRTDTLEFLCTLNPNTINYQHSPLSETPLMVACRSNSFRDVKFLLDHGADITLSDSNQNTILHLEYTKTSRGCLPLILNHPKVSTIINAKNVYGDTPLATLLKSIGDYAREPKLNDWDEDGEDKYFIPHQASDIENLMAKGANPYIKIVCDEIYNIYSFMESTEKRTDQKVISQAKIIFSAIKKAISSYIKNNIPEIVNLLLTKDSILYDPKTSNGLNEKIILPWTEHQGAIFNEFEKRIKSKNKLAVDTLLDVKNSTIFTILSIKKFPFFSSYGEKLITLQTQFSQANLNLKQEREMHDMATYKK